MRREADGVHLRARHRHGPRGRRGARRHRAPAADLRPGARDRSASSPARRSTVDDALEVDRRGRRLAVRGRGRLRADRDHPPGQVRRPGGGRRHRGPVRPAVSAADSPEGATAGDRALSATTSARGAVEPLPGDRRRRRRAAGRVHPSRGRLGRAHRGGRARKGLDVRVIGYDLAERRGRQRASPRTTPGTRADRGRRRARRDRRRHVRRSRGRRDAARRDDRRRRRGAAGPALARGARRTRRSARSGCACWRPRASEHDEGRTRRVRPVVVTVSCRRRGTRRSTAPGRWPPHPGARPGRSGRSRTT